MREVISFNRLVFIIFGLVEISIWTHAILHGSGGQEFRLVLFGHLFIVAMALALCLLWGGIYLIKTRAEIFMRRLPGGNLI